MIRMVTAAALFPEPAQPTVPATAEGLSSWRCRRLVSLYKHVALALSEDNRIFVLHLWQELTVSLILWPLQAGEAFLMYQLQRWGGCPLSRHESPRFIALSLYQSLAPATMTLPFSMRGSGVFTGLVRFQRHWREARDSATTTTASAARRQPFLSSSSSLSPLDPYVSDWRTRCASFGGSNTFLRQAHIDRKHREENGAMISQLDKVQTHIEKAIESVAMQHDNQQAECGSMLAAITANVEAEAEAEAEAEMVCGAERIESVPAHREGLLASTERKEGDRAGNRCWGDFSS